ncbi:MAG: rhodanese-like domain-containing protein [Pseudomonadota bacterium]|jgi:rhodanese-related sulfurtransferase
MSTKPPAVPGVDVAMLRQWLADGEEIAFFDVREHGQYGEGHPFFAVPLPYSRFELDLERLAPRRDVRMVLMDDGDGVARRALARAAVLGYTGARLLEGGAPAWRAAGHTLFAGVNVPSKTFGELVEHACDTPRITADELLAMRARGEDFVIVDGRPWGEYTKMNIPGGICCPNGELALRLAAIAPDPSTTVVVNCAGRTRSIIGAQTLRHFGVPNRVVALKDGTQGWFLAGHQLERGAQRRYPAPPAALDPLRERAAALAARFAVPTVDAAQASAMLDDASRTTYLLDVRTEEEFAQGSLPGAVHAPGGQLIQATDQWVGVRGARILLVDAEGVRAPVVAMWLRQLGHDAQVLGGGVSAPLAWQPPVARAPAVLPGLAEVGAGQAKDTPIIDLRAGMAYRRAHPAPAVWGIRPRIAAVLERLAARGPVTLVADEPAIARAAAVDIVERGGPPPRLLEGGFAAWQAAGLPVAATPDQPDNAACIDYLFFVHDRHEGNREAAMQYLAWETQLIGQLDELERGSFRVQAA